LEDEIPREPQYYQFEKIILSTKTKQKVVMICTAARGGMRSVVEGYLADGLFSRWDVVLLSPHAEGGLALRLITAMKAFLTFLRFLIKGQVSLVHCHSAMKGSFWRKSVFALVSRMAGVPVVFHLHGSEMKTFVDKQPVLLQRLISWILEKQSVVVVLSESWLLYIKTISPRANIVILPNYVDLPDLQSKTVTTNDDAVEVLFLGLVGTRKGVYDLLPAFKEAIAHAGALRLIIGGNGEVDQARALAVKLKIEDYVVFAGWVSGDEKVKLLRRAQIYVLPSYNEGLPVSLLEAMSWQVPVISTCVGGIPELVREGVDGLLIKAGDQDALTSSIVKLAQDANLRIKMGVEARKQVERNFSKQVVLPRLEELYRFFIFRNKALGNSNT
jgi:glycosyltransferase involved in cell wall biosynthesis